MYPSLIVCRNERDFYPVISGGNTIPFVGADVFMLWRVFCQRATVEMRDEFDLDVAVVNQR